MNTEAFYNGLTIFSFVIGLMNLEENLTQGGKQDIMKNLDTKADTLLSEIHSHLELQDKKIDKILLLLEKNYSQSGSSDNPSITYN